MVTLREINNLRRKIKRAKSAQNIKLLEKYILELDRIIAEIELIWRPTLRHSYSYDQFEKGLLRRSGLHGYRPPSSDWRTRFNKRSRQKACREGGCWEIPDSLHGGQRGQSRREAIANI